MTIPRPAGYSTLTCSKCSTKAVLEDAAWAHLHALLWPAVCAWAQHWSVAGVGQSRLADILEIEGLFWHPDGHLARPGQAEQAIEEALAEASA
jgi:hypothetical protein